MPTLLAESGANGNNQSFTVSAGTSRRGIAAFSLEYNSIPTVSATLGGVSLTLIDTAVSNGGAGQENAVFVFDIKETDFASIGTGAKVLAFTVTGGSGNQGGQSFFSHVDDADQGALVVTKASAGTVNVNPAAGSAYVVAISNINHTGVTATASSPSGAAIFFDQADGGGDLRAAGLSAASVAAGSVAATITWSGGSRPAIAAVVIEDAGGAASGLLLRRRR